MQHNRFSKLIRLPAEVIKDIEADDWRASGSAIAIRRTGTEADSLRMLVELGATALHQAASAAKNMSTRRDFGDGQVVGDIDGDLRGFLAHLSRKVSYLSNSATLRGDLGEFELFDQLELMDAPASQVPTALAQAQSTLKWWEDAQYLTSGPHGEHNVFNEEPEFVTQAKAIVAQAESTDAT